MEKNFRIFLVIAGCFSFLILGYRWYFKNDVRYRKIISENKIPTLFTPESTKGEQVSDIKKTLDEYDSMPESGSGYNGRNTEIELLQGMDGEIRLSGNNMYFCNINDVKFSYVEVGGNFEKSKVISYVEFKCMQDSCFTCIRSENVKIGKGLIEVYNEEHGKRVIGKLKGLREFYKKE